jgi:hypothetical protein
MAGAGRLLAGAKLHLQLARGLNLTGWASHKKYDPDVLNF